MAGFRNYAVMYMVLAAYIMLILLLHIQLQGFDKTKHGGATDTEREASRHVLNHGVVPPRGGHDGQNADDWALSFHQQSNSAPLKSDLIAAGEGYEGEKLIHSDKETVFKALKKTWHSYLLDALGKMPRLRQAQAPRALLSGHGKTPRYPSNHSDSLPDKNVKVDQYLRESMENSWHDSNSFPSSPDMGSETVDKVGIETVQSVLHPIPPHCNSDESLNVESRFQAFYQHYIYTAYMDDRNAARPMIRIITLLHKSNKFTFSCHFKIQTHDVNSSYIASTPVEFYEMCENHAKEYGGWILSCEVPSLLASPPCSVMLIAHSPNNPQPTKLILPVYTLGANSTPAKVDFGVCIPPLFGNIPSMTLINFIEFTQLLGANHFIFYNYQVSSEIRQVLDYYQRRGTLSVVRWAVPIKDKHIWYHGQLAAINDCLYRSMHRFKYVAFNDIDEYIVPRGTRDWSALVSRLGKVHPGPLAGFSFQSAFFDPNLGESHQIVYNLEAELRTRVTSKVRTKVLVQPRHVFELGIHHVSRAYDRSFEVAHGDPGEVLIHHYRKCTADFDPRMNCQVFVKDEALSGFIPTARYRVHRTLWRLQQLAQARTRHGRTS